MTWVVASTRALACPPFSGEELASCSSALSEWLGMGKLGRGATDCTSKLWVSSSPSGCIESSFSGSDSSSSSSERRIWDIPKRDFCKNAAIDDYVEYRWRREEVGCQRRVVT
ncbi:hypothetical protein V565_038450 [Rhizoctonia solani 123E]|uniref:Uncharacterized protein n=1 Tax=Rhizoctonia solani 123E TaxID=1423351 RepID=A0A074S7N1_9AGAM|nr:hypothetical protein V565_038450 [Rhizoctonia solani 123E]